MDQPIREAFDARIFLSFDPADRMLIRPVMRGVGAEIDRDRALCLLTAAAQEGHPEGAEAPRAAFKARLEEPR